LLPFLNPKDVTEIKNIYKNINLIAEKYIKHTSKGGVESRRRKSSSWLESEHLFG